MASYFGTRLTKKIVLRSLIKLSIEKRSLTSDVWLTRNHLFRKHPKRFDSFCPLNKCYQRNSHHFSNAAESCIKMFFSFIVHKSQRCNLWIWAFCLPFNQNLWFFFSFYKKHYTMGNQKEEFHVFLCLWMCEPLRKRKQRSVVCGFSSLLSWWVCVVVNL